MHTQEAQERFYSSPSIKRYLFTSDDYHRMDEAGIFQSGTRTELIKGTIITMSPVGFNHSRIVRLLNHFFSTNLSGDKFIIDSQNPVLVSKYSEPQPDIVILKFREDFYREHPAPSDIHMIIEVSDSTLKMDQQIKMPVYAENQIPVYWIVNILEKCVEVYQDPKSGLYQQVTRYYPGDTLKAELAGAELFLDLRQIFPD